MTPAQMDEARRWVALRGWRWMPGMRAVTPMADFAGRLTEATLGIARPVYPDVTDPATRGCLLALAREITGEPRLHVRHLHTDRCWVASWPGADDRAPRTYDGSETLPLLEACEAHERGEAP